MFGWFTPQCPVDHASKQWIEKRLSWLALQFGRDVFTRRAMILPSDDFFPDPVDGSEKSIRNLFDQVCRYMDVEPSDIVLNLVRQKNDVHLIDKSGNQVSLGFGGLYEERSRKTVIHLEMTELCDLEG